MPVMDGFTASRHIRDLEGEFSAGAAYVIIALTADATTEASRACLEAGMDGVLTKPMQAASLVELFFKLREGKRIRNPT
jgi:CheY-like chemotaxis protein